MLANYSFIGLFFIAAVSFPILPLVGAYFLRPRRPTEIKLDTYECGLEAIGDIWVQFKVQYYIYGLIFMVFDVEIVFFYPWATVFPDAVVNPVGNSGLLLIEIVLFVLILLLAYIYAWGKGVFQWD